MSVSAVIVTRGDVPVAESVAAAESKVGAMGAIYGLTDKRTGEIRYVGKTVRPLRARLSQHLTDARKTSIRTYCASWIKSVGRENVGIVELEADPPDLGAAERAWIGRLGSAGRLTNLTSGGDGGSGARSPETRAKISAGLRGKPKSPEHAARVGAANRGKAVSEETRAKLRAAWARGPATRHTPESRRKISEGNKRAHAARRSGSGQDALS